MGGLALIGGLAAACFAKAFGVVFLGVPRRGPAAEARESGPWVCGPLVVLAVACAVLALVAPLLLNVLAPAVGQIASQAGLPLDGTFAQARRLLATARDAGFGVAVLVGVVAGVRWLVLRRRTVARACTWDCGYARPNARMQYTASSFAQPLVEFFGGWLRVRTALKEPAGVFPDAASLSTHATD